MATSDDTAARLVVNSPLSRIQVDCRWARERASEEDLLRVLAGEVTCLNVIKVATGCCVGCRHLARPLASLLKLAEDRDVQDRSESAPRCPPAQAGVTAAECHRQSPQKAGVESAAPRPDHGRPTPAFQFYANDWLSSPKIALMSPEEEAAYLRLLLYSWVDSDCSVPDDDGVLAVYTRLGERWLNGCSGGLNGCSEKVRKCFISRNGRLYNERLLKEREKQEAWREQKRGAGVRSGEIRRRNKHEKQGSSTSNERSLRRKPKLPPKANEGGFGDPSNERSQTNERAFTLQSSVFNLHTHPPTPQGRNGCFNPAPGCERFLSGYSGEIKLDHDRRLYHKVIDTVDKERTLLQNWPLWEQSGQFSRGFKHSAENFLRKGIWQSPPKEGRSTEEVDFIEYMPDWEDDHATN